MTKPIKTIVHSNANLNTKFESNILFTNEAMPFKKKKQTNKKKKKKKKKKTGRGHAEQLYVDF